MARHCSRHNSEQNQVAALIERDILLGVGGRVEWGGKVKNTTVLAETPLSSDQSLLTPSAIPACHLGC